MGSRARTGNTGGALAASERYKDKTVRSRRFFLPFAILSSEKFAFFRAGFAVVRDRSRRKYSFDAHCTHYRAGPECASSRPIVARSIFNEITFFNRSTESPRARDTRDGRDDEIRGNFLSQTFLLECMQVSGMVLTVL